MTNNRNILFIGLLVILRVLLLIVCPAYAQSTTQSKGSCVLVISKSANVREKYGIERLEKTLKETGYVVSRQYALPVSGNFILVGTNRDGLVAKAFQENKVKPESSSESESFFIVSLSNSKIVITGNDETGVLYGCLELSERIKKRGALPENVNIKEQPQMILRGTCIGLQKTTYLPGRTVYEYPYTPESFPWFYDKDLWIRYLDMLVENRINSLYLWNGHPFASLVRLKDYPYAVEVDEETFKKNEAIFQFLTEEADKRGIWIIQMFYNIIVSKPFAEKHQLKTQDRSRPIIPVIADYTRKSIAAFIEKYPNVGLLITLGEAMEDADDIEWFTQTIIPGVKDGLKALGRKDEPPIVLRGHDSNPQEIMEVALPLYKNLYTMAKYNGEALTTYEPRGPWAAMHRDLSALGSIHIDNVHILANLEPFRFGSADFIQKSVQAMHAKHGAKGLHLYPQASYWDWPYTADHVQPRLLQIERDWIWYKAWARYAWDAQRDREQEINYWSDLLSNKYGCDAASGKLILKAYEEAGEIAPKLLRRFGITNGNRQTLTLGMFMDQLIDPHRYRVWPDLYNSDGPEGEMLIEYAEKDWKNESHIGETPVQIIDEVVVHGKQAVTAIAQAASSITKDKQEFQRVQNDIKCYDALANFYASKVNAARHVLRYKYSNDINDLVKAIPFLEKSVADFTILTELTRDFYLYANSMQTGQRKIPIGGDGGKNKTWEELLPHYQQELTNFKRNIDSLKSSVSKKSSAKSTVLLRNVGVNIKGSHHEFYTLNEGQSLFNDTILIINAVANELKGLTAVRLSSNEQRAKGTVLKFKTKKTIQILIGYFQKPGDMRYLAPPNLETNAQANDQGQAEIKIADAIKAEGLPPVNVHVFTFPSGSHTFTLNKGLCLVLGIIDAESEVPVYNAALTTNKKELNWLFN